MNISSLEPCALFYNCECFICQEKDVNDDSPEPRLPLLDRHAQSQLRVRDAD